MLELPIEKKVQIIQEFKPIEKPDFLENDALIYSIWLLYNRAYCSMKSFLVLQDNKYYYDAFIMTGQTLETCATLSYIKDNPEKQISHYHKYTAKCTISRLITILYMNKTLEDEMSWTTYFSLINFLYPIGTNIIKKDKLSGKTRQERHEEVMEQVKYRDGINADKIELLKKYYNYSEPGRYIKVFSKNLDNFDDGELSRFYTTYCDFKHNNLLSPGIDPQDIDIHSLEWSLDILVILIKYLHDSKLSPIDLKSFFTTAYSPDKV